MLSDWWERITHNQSHLTSITISCVFRCTCPVWIIHIMYDAMIGTSRLEGSGFIGVIKTFLCGCSCSLMGNTGCRSEWLYCSIVNIMCTCCCRLIVNGLWCCAGNWCQDIWVWRGRAWPERTWFVICAPAISFHLFHCLWLYSLKYLFIWHLLGV